MTPRSGSQQRGSARVVEHEHVTGDSIVTVLMDHDDPMSAVLESHA